MAIPLSEIEPLLPSPSRQEHSSIQEVGGWQPDPLRPDIEELNPAQRTQAAARWAAVGLDAHLGAANASRFAMSLLSIAAPARLVEDALKIASDRVRHARMGFGLASAYADRPIGPRATAVLTPLLSLEAVLNEAISEYCINTTIAAVCAAEAQAESEDPAVWETLRTITEDTWTHARTGWDVIAWALHTGPPGIEQDLRTKINQHISQRQRQNPIIEQPESMLDTTILMEHGCLPAATRHRIQRVVLVQVIRPCVDQILCLEP